MKVKITLPLTLKDGNKATISFYAELEAPYSLTDNGKTEVARIEKPIISVH